MNHVVRWMGAVASLACSVSLPAAGLQVEGPIQTNSGGLVFPDGTIQTTAANPDPTAVGPVIGSLNLTSSGPNGQTFPPLTLYGIDLDLENPPLPGTSYGGSRPILQNLSLKLDASDVSPELFLSVAARTPFSNVRISLAGITISLTGQAYVDSHMQLAPEEPGVPQLTTLSIVTSHIQVSSANQTAGWDFWLNQSDGATCDNADRVYAVARGQDTAGLNGVVVPTTLYEASIIGPTGSEPGATKASFNPFQVQLRNQHDESICLLQYVLNASATPSLPQSIGMVTLFEPAAPSAARAPVPAGYIAYDLTHPFAPSDWKLESDSSGNLIYQAAITPGVACHRVSLDGGDEVRRCWSTETNSEP